MERKLCWSEKVQYWKKKSNNMGSYINDSVTSEEFDALENCLDRLCNINVNDYPSYFNSKNAFIFITLFSKFLAYGLEDSKFEKFLSELPKMINKSVCVNDRFTTFSELDSERGTKDKSLIQKKLFVLEVLMRSFFNIQNIGGDEVVHDIIDNQKVDNIGVNYNEAKDIVACKIAAS